MGLRLYGALANLVLLSIPRLKGSGEVRVANIGSPRNVLKDPFLAFSCSRSTDANKAKYQKSRLLAG